MDILVRNDYAEKNGVNSIEEVIEKKIPTNFVIKQAGTMGELAFVQLLEGLGVTEEGADRLGLHDHSYCVRQYQDRYAGWHGRYHGRPSAQQSGEHR